MTLLMKIALLAALLALGAAGCAPEPTRTPTVALVRPTATLAVAEPNPTPGSPARSLSATPTPGPEMRASGRFVFTPGDGSIWIQDAATGRAEPLVKAQADNFADSPAFSADGRRVAYTVNSLTAQGVVQISVYLISAEGQNPHVLARPPDLKTTYNWPAFSPDGKWVYYTSSYPVPPNRQHSEIQRVPVGGGPAETVLEDAHRAVLAPDGRSLAFLRFNFRTFSASLWVADANGANPRQLLSDDVFAALGTPSFSPGGEWLLVAASGPPSRPLPTSLVLPRPACEPALLCALAETAHADGLPWDLWLARTDGKQFRQLTQIGADSPAPAWSRDGKTVAFLDTNGIYLVDVQTRAVTRLSKNGGHGSLSWWQPPETP